jgi:uncharacterized protein (DUF952 family)
MIYHITTPELWEEGQQKGVYIPPSFEKEGFIHLSQDFQLQRTANKHFKGQQHLVILSVDETRLTAPLRFEDLYNNNEDFPHIYGPLNLEAVVAIRQLEPGPDGIFVI